MRASIIVCTRNRADSIGETLLSLAQQTYRDCEVIVVDTSDDSQRETIRQLAEHFGALYVYEPRSGLSIARNTGIARSSGDVIAFTDDDCIPASNWIEIKLKSYSNPNVWCCTGRVIQHSSAGACDLFNEVAGQDLGPESRIFTRDDTRFRIGILFGNVIKIFAKHMKSRAPVPFGIGHGSSTSFCRLGLKQLGGFDERLGGGAPLKSADDTEMFYRILKSGHIIVYEPSAVVRHKHGLNSADVYKTRYGYSFGGAAFMWENRRDRLMFFMFFGRLIQLVIKTMQYRLTREKELFQSFNADLHGFLDGWKIYRRSCKTTLSPIGKQPAIS